MDKTTETAGSSPVQTGLIGPSQALRKSALTVVVVLALAFLFIGDSRWPNGSWMHEGIEWAGLTLVVSCIVGRTWCAIYIGGNKNKTLVTTGPYSVSRNPLYAFSIIGAVGVGAQVGSLVAALVCGFIAWSIFLLTVRQEEVALAAAFPETYGSYAARVPRFLPRLSLWQAPSTVLVEPRIIFMTFFDGLFFLAAVPLAETLEYLHDAQILPVLLRLA